jgi:hypothetical protein
MTLKTHPNCPDCGVDIHHHRVDPQTQVTSYKCRCGYSCGEPNKPLTLEERREKLKNIKDSIPGAPPEMVEFASHLSARIKLNNDPEDFIDACKLLMSDLRKGRDGFSGKPIESSFMGCDSSIANDIMMTVVPFLAAEVLPEIDSSNMRNLVRGAGLAVLF